MVPETLESVCFFSSISPLVIMYSLTSINKILIKSTQEKLASCNVILALCLKDMLDNETDFVVILQIPYEGLHGHKTD